MLSADITATLLRHVHIGPHEHLMTRSDRPAFALSVMTDTISLHNTVAVAVDIICVTCILEGVVCIINDAIMT